MSNFFLAGAALGFFALGVPASATPLGNAAAIISKDKTAVTQVRSLRYRYPRGYYQPRIVRQYIYDQGGPAYYGSYYAGGPSYYGPYLGGIPSYHGPVFGLGYGGVPSIGFSFGGRRW